MYGNLRESVTNVFDGIIKIAEMEFYEDYGTLCW